MSKEPEHIKNVLDRVVGKLTLSRKANEYAENAANSDMYPEPILGDNPSLEDYERQRRWLQYYCQKRVEFFGLASRKFGKNEEG